MARKNTTPALAEIAQKCDPHFIAALEAQKAPAVAKADPAKADPAKPAAPKPEPVAAPGAGAVASAPDLAALVAQLAQQNAALQAQMAQLVARVSQVPTVAPVLAVPLHDRPQPQHVGAGFAVRGYDRNPDNAEVTFQRKPADEIRAALKAAGFRWSPRFGLWYGPASALPACLR